MVDRSQAGHFARAQGEGFEAWLCLYHEMLAHRGLALVHKTGPQVRYTRQRGQVTPVVTGEGPPDYMGATFTGRAVCFEAKSTANKHRLTLLRNREHQRRYLIELHTLTAGRAACFYLVEWRAWGEVRLHWIDSLDGRKVVREDGILLEECYWFNGIEEEP